MSCPPNCSGGKNGCDVSAKRALEERARAEAAAEGKGKEEQEKVKPDPKMQYNFSDPGSRILKGPDGFLQGYNAQIAVEPVWQLIVGQGVTQEANDKRQLLPMLRKVQEQSGQTPTAVLADNGYFSEENLQGAAKMQVDAYLAAGKQKHNQVVPPCPRGPIPKTATILERMRRKLQTILGRKIYARRKVIVEPVFGQIKHRQGFRQFLLRGANKVRRMVSGLYDAQHLEAPPRLLYVIGAVECGRTVALARKNRELCPISNISSLR
jgi:hypothetical protein